jgi:hypothetical protein
MRALPRLLFLTALLGCSVSAWADIYVIVNHANPIQHLTQKDVLNLYMGRTHAFADGDYALGFDLPRGNPVRSEFYQTLTGLSDAQVASYWARLMFTGQTLPPQPLPSEGEMLSVVGRNPSAIGYVGKAPADADVRVVLVIRSAR